MKKQTIKSYIGIIIGLILSFNVGLYAWSGIQAQDGDKLSVAKWNEMTSGVWGRYGAAMHYTGGNVGIGTSAPGAKLEVLSSVNDGIYLRSDIGDDAGDLVFQKLDRTELGRLHTNYDGTIYLRAGSPGFGALTLKQNGNVGIGSTNPFTKLSVHSDVSTTDLTNGYGQMILGGSTSTTKRMILGYETTANFGFLQGNTYGSTWDNIAINPRGGNVGIGTTSTTNNKLHIVGGSLSINPTGIGEMHQIGGMSIQHGGPNWPERAIQIAPASQNQNSVILQAAKDSSSTHWWTYGVETNNSFHIGRGAGNLSGDFVINSAGNITVGGTLTQSSDQRYKKDIVNISNSLNKLQNINGVYYKRKDETKSKQTQIGFIAQNLEKEFPELVSTDTNGYKSVNYSNMTAVLVEAVKEQQKQIINLENELKKLRKINNFILTK